MLIKTCPIGKDLVDENVSRAVALWVVGLSLAFLVSGNLLIVAFLIFDFAARAFCLKFSLLAHLNRTILHSILKLKPKPYNAAPKKFAAKLGLIFSIIMASLPFAPAVALTSALFLIFAASLEGFFGVCIGCILYSLLFSYDQTR